jgi:hypothetical protein
VDSIKAFIKTNINVILRIITGVGDLKSNDSFMIQAKEVDLLDIIFNLENEGSFAKSSPSSKLSQFLMRNAQEIDSMSL